MRYLIPYFAALVLVGPGLCQADAGGDLRWRTPADTRLVPVPQPPGVLPSKVTTGPITPSQTIRSGRHYDPLAPMQPKSPGNTRDAVDTQGTVARIASSGVESRPAIQQVANQHPLPTQPGDSTVPTVPSQLRLPQDKANLHGQVWREYDLRPHTRRTNGRDDKPQQAIVDWVLRETGTETWFSEPFAALSASRDTLRVYHTPAVQQIVADIVNRFTRADETSLSFGACLVTLSNPDWRTTAISTMRPVAVQSSGVEAWLLSKENAAVLLRQLQQRSDYREHNSPNLLIRNGETHQISRTRPISYVQSLQASNQPGGGASRAPRLRQIEEGFEMKISPLLAADRQTVDAVVKIETNQVEKLSHVWMNATVGATTQRAEVQVPQTSSWRLHERFRWPVNEVLVISCGLAASPTIQSPPTGLLRALTARPPRSEALLFLEAKETAESIAAGATGDRIGAMNYRGRY